MTFYSNWFKYTVSSSNGPSSNATTALQADLTPAQITVITTRGKLIYNLEYKPVSKKVKPKNSEYHCRESTTSSNTFATANVVAGKFQNRSNKSYKWT